MGCLSPRAQKRVQGWRSQGVPLLDKRGTQARLVHIMFSRYESSAQSVKRLPNILRLENLPSSTS